MVDLQPDNPLMQSPRRPSTGSLTARLRQARGEQERRRAPAPDAPTSGAMGDDTVHDRGHGAAERPSSARDSAPRRRKRRDAGVETITTLSQGSVERAPAAIETATAKKDDYDAVALAMDLMEQEFANVASGLEAHRVEIESLGLLAYKTEPRGAGAPDEGAPDNEVASANVAELREQARQAHDELAAARRRGEREKEEYTRFAKGETIKSFIPVLDDLERALAHVPARLSNDPWVVGVTMVGESVSAMLRREGVERIDPHGEPFDPRMHEAIARVESESGEAGVDDEASVDGGTDVGVTVEQRVTQVYQPGYALNGRVLRPAMVQVTTSRQQSTVDCYDDGDNLGVDRLYRLIADHPSLLTDTRGLE
jgi:molecular chaperone GrpE